VDEVGEHLGSQTKSGAFVMDCAQGRHNAAWDSTSKAFRARVSRQEFDALLAKHKLGRTIAGANFPMTLHTAGAHRYRWDVHPIGAQPVTMTVQMTREGELWKVDELSIDPWVGKEKK
jgi:hypothetical protein